MTVSNSMPSVGATGGNGRLTVTAGRECTWSVTSNVPWITPTSPAGGQGDGSVEYVVAPNPAGDVRRGSVSMGGQVLEVVQEGLPCRFELQPASQRVEPEGGNGSFTVEGPTGCSWTPTASEDWITIGNGGSQSGNGSVSFSIAPNPAAPRGGAISVGGQVFAISQASPACRFQLSPVTRSFGGAGGPGTVSVAGARGCTWTASANVPWISIVGGTSGNGNGTVSFSVQANADAARNGTVTIGGQRFTVTQQQAECNYSIAPADYAFTATGGQQAVTVSTGSLCTWNTSDVPPWITGVPASGTGRQAFTFTVDPNPGSARNAAIIVGGQTLAVSQAAGCSYSLTPVNHNASAGGGGSTVAVNTAAGCSWTTSGVPAWITGVPPNGVGPQAINFVVAGNSAVARSADIVIGGQAFVVSQPGACSYSLTPGNYNPPAGGGTSSFAANTAAGCAWTSSGVPAWITGVPASGTGPRTITLTVAANTAGTRTANVMIGGQTFVVTQAAAGCTYSLSPTSHSAAAAGGSSAVEMSTRSDCGWTSSGVPAWITGIPASGTGPASIDFTVEGNANLTARSVNITIGGRTFAVTQAATVCAYSLSPTSYNAAGGGGSSELDVNTSAACAWTTSGVPTWVTGIPASGTGTTNIDFTVAPNPNPSTRNANITIAGRNFALTQAAAACAYSLNPTSYNAGAGGGSSAFNVSTATGCGWTSSGVPAWVKGVPASGTGPATINFDVDANPGSTSRSANISIGGRTFAVTQAGAACTYSLSPTSYNANSGGGSSTFNITTPAGCNWTSSGVPTWVKDVPASGTGPATVNFTVDANPSSASRSVNMTIGGRTFALTQAGAVCTYSLSPTSYHAAAGGGSSKFNITTPAGCGWTSSNTPSWIKGIPSSGTSSTTINFTVAANASRSSRSANITIGGRNFAVTQAGAP